MRNCPECGSDNCVQNGSIHNDNPKCQCNDCDRQCKETGKTNHIERFNCTMRQRISRLVRKTLSFSKKLENHIGAIWYFIHHYNASLA